MSMRNNLFWPCQLTVGTRSSVELLWWLVVRLVDSVATFIPSVFLSLLHLSLLLSVIL